jgi:hypothetical protein
MKSAVRVPAYKSHKPSAQAKPSTGQAQNW